MAAAALLIRQMEGLWQRARAHAPWLRPIEARLARLAVTLRPIIEHPLFERFILILILINAVTLGLETMPDVMARFGGLIHLLDWLILIIFVLEIGSRMLVRGWRFWRDGWSVFDFVVVSVTFLPGSDNISVLRALRTIRALRLISIVPSMRRVVTGLLNALPGMGSIVVLLTLIFYVFSVMATNMFGSAFPELFGGIGNSAYTLFQVMTLEGWSADVVRPVMATYPWAWAFFIPFILITSFTVLNLFIGIIVDAMQQQHFELRAEAERKLAQRIGKLDTAFGERVVAQKSTDASQDARMDLLMSELKLLRSELVAHRPNGRQAGKTEG